MDIYRLAIIENMVTLAAATGLTLGLYTMSGSWWALTGMLVLGNLNSVKYKTGLKETDTIPDKVKMTEQEAQFLKSCWDDGRIQKADARPGPAGTVQGGPSGRIDADNGGGYPSSDAPFVEQAPFSEQPRRTDGGMH